MEIDIPGNTHSLPAIGHWSDVYPENASVLLIGGLPPPLGGVSVHIHRLLLLLTESGRSARVFDPSKCDRFRGHEKAAFILQLLRGGFDIVHVQGFDFSRSLMRLILFAKRILGFRLYATAHSFRLSGNSPPEDIAIHRSMLENLDTLVAVHASIPEKMRALGLALPDRIKVIPAFLPPSEVDEGRIWKTYPPEISDFFAVHKPVLVANAFKLIFYQGEDLYGIDLCIGLTDRLRARFPDIGFIFALADDSHERPYLENLRKRISGLGLEDRFLILSGQRELWPLTKRADLMVRPTNTDGDAISIREALHFRRPVVASDVCERPEGTVLFASRDNEDFQKKVAYVLDEKRHHVQD